MLGKDNKFVFCHEVRKAQSFDKLRLVLLTTTT